MRRVSCSGRPVATATSRVLFLIAVLACACLWPGAAVASTGNEGVQLALTDPTHVSVKLTDTDAMGTVAISVITFNTNDGSLASVALGGASCSATGVVDGQLCSPVTQLPGQTLQATLTLNTAQTARLHWPFNARVLARAHASKSKEVQVCAKAAAQEAFTCEQGELTGTTPPAEVKDCDDFEIHLTGSRPYDISSYKGGRAYLAFTLKNVGNCASSAGTVAVNGLGIFSSYGAPLPAIAAAAASELLIGVTSSGAGNPGTVATFKLELPADTDASGESGQDPASSISENLILDPLVEMRILSGSARASAAAAGGGAQHLQGTVVPGSRRAPDPVVSTQVAVQMLGAPRGTCRWLSGARILSTRAHAGRCDKPRWQRARMTFKPNGTLALQFGLAASLPHGTYEAIARATLKSGTSNHTYPRGIDAVRFRR